jgi:hypothetical protein
MSESGCAQFTRNARNIRGKKFETRMVFKTGEFNNRQKMSGLSGLCLANVGIVGILFHQICVILVNCPDRIWGMNGS